ncbi:carboxymuconolactone decarboxylase family protein [Methanofollis aquaemaris]|uniref:Carboxymuconolactone decarboxylase family protein n=1 Tax=Methanofollis aquaemaris TaxID=126734 RepID=A0A8A3S5P4_9EURY|nr:carboxymuconolactone decarboxylase family protein [Methanofollis aquaemaris]QSZ67577.1 carboxymuconolactone decarboxylase family protein [Methanofollis aquaemaris]
MTEIRDYLSQVQQTNTEIAEFDPEVWDTFLPMVRSISKAGAIPAKYKEIMMIALAVADHCPFCIAMHVKIAINAGATRQEIMEGALTAVPMGGGPAMAYMRYVIDACNEFEAP